MTVDPTLIRIAATLVLVALTIKWLARIPLRKD